MMTAKFPHWDYPSTFTMLRLCYHLTNSLINKIMTLPLTLI